MVIFNGVTKIYIIENNLESNDKNVNLLKLRMAKQHLVCLAPEFYMPVLLMKNSSLNLALGHATYLKLRHCICHNFYFDEICIFLLDSRERGKNLLIMVS